MREHLHNKKSSKSTNEIYRVLIGNYTEPNAKKNNLNRFTIGEEIRQHDTKKKKKFGRNENLLF